LDTFDNNISNNKINVGGWGISIGDEYVSGNHLFGNQISGGLGIEINWFNTNNTLEGNTISGCRYGIHLGVYLEGYGPCSGNVIFHNNFLNNVQQVFLGSGSIDVWDNACLLGGNYWSDYRGIDANKDGSGDTPYVIDSKNVDRYPLMSIWNVTSAEQ
jgi:nitrous oxidase accessory protein